MNYKNDVFKISFVGIMLSLVFLFQFLERYMNLNIGFVKLNISLSFIILTYYVANLKYAILLFILRFVIGPAIGQFGYSSIGFWSHFILLVYDFLFFLMFILIYKWTNNLFMSFVFSIFILSILSGFLNGFLFIPVYFAIIKDGYGLPINIENTKIIYMKIKNLGFFGISNYWKGMFVVYSLTSLIKFSIICSLYFAILQIIIKTPYKRYIKKIVHLKK